MASAVVVVAALSLGVIGCSSDPDPGTFDDVTTSSLTPLISAATTTSSTTSTSTTTTSTTTTTTTTLPPTTTTEPIITQGAIVLVANGSRVPGAAARLTATLADVGFILNSPVNAAGSDEDLPDSRIYAGDINDPVARSISRLMGGVPVLRMPTPVPVETGSAADATVVVMLGKDLADADLVQL